MRTRSSELSVEQHLADDPVLEMQLVDIKGSFFFGEPGIEPAAFVEVCGALARSRGSSVTLLHFQRCDRFYEITNENLELAACRQELEAASSFAVIVLESARRSEGVGGEIASKRRLLVPTQPFEALQTPLQRP